MPTATDLDAVLVTAEPDDVLEGAADLWLAECGDAELSAAVGRVLTVPRRGPGSSFVLHSGLEWLARSALLAWVPEPRRIEARRRLVWLAATYVRAGDPVDDVEPAAESSGAALLRAIDAGDVNEADATAQALVCGDEVEEIVRCLAPGLVTHLGAAAHAPIFLSLLARCRSNAGPLRGLARSLAAQAGERVTWQAGLGGRPAPEPADLEAVVGAVVSAERPASTFILPLVRHGEATAERVLAPALGGDTDVRAVRIAFQRVAARSMLLDDPAEAPYGWTHALTIPQAIGWCAALTVSPVETVAVAATHLVSYRVGFGRISVDRATPTANVPPSWAELAAFASAHHDAHLVKYVLACIDAARLDREAGELYRSAAAHLAAWWTAVGDVAPGA